MPVLDFASIRGVALDIDGVVWRGKLLLPGVPDIFGFFGRHGIPYMLLSNNSTRTVPEYVAEIAAKGIPMTEQNLLNSAQVTLDYLRGRYAPGTRLYVVGSDSLRRLLVEEGKYIFDPAGAQVVVIGIDFDLSYDKLKIAGQRIMAGATFIATNTDATFPHADGIGPGNGSIVAAVQTMTGQTPLVMGKPELPMFESAVGRLGHPAAQCLMIGDRLDTDILGAARAGMRTALVRSGVHQPDSVPGIRAEADFADLAEVLYVWRSAVER